MFLTWRAHDDRLVERLDPGYWHPIYDRILSECALPLVPLGEFIEHITYGAIVTGRRQPDSPDGLLLIGQGALRLSGLDLAGLPRVPSNSPWDLERARVRRGDLLIARSGAGSLERNRLVVCHEDEPAVVDCFVDLVRLRGVDPDFVAVFLRTRLGWAQIHRLLNGVGPANLSFDEIRSLRVPLAPDDLQSHVAARHAEEVLPPHRARRFDEADAAARAIVVELEERLARRRASP
ncbi:MAG: hypothetical protein AB7Y46_07550 [Armatimonadota bacterium]